MNLNKKGGLLLLFCLGELFRNKKGDLKYIGQK